MMNADKFQVCLHFFTLKTTQYIISSMLSARTDFSNQNILKSKSPPLYDTILTVERTMPS